jgi:hypothetical protein
VRFVEARGLTVRAMIREPDHGPLRSSASLLHSVARADRHTRVDLWLATAKCAVHLAAARHLTPRLAIVASIDYSLSLGGEILERLRWLGSP